jgi:Uma2 family endonuclease
MATATPLIVEQASPAVEPDALFEIVDGKYVEKPGMGAYEIWLGYQIARMLESVAAIPAAGRVVPEMLFDLRPVVNRHRRPDVAFVSFERWPADRDVPRSESWPVVPELAIEVVSPSNTSAEVKKKTREYLAAGVRQVWIVYPETGEVECYDAPTSVRIVEAGGVLDASALWPGVAIVVDRLLALPEAGRAG